MKEPLLDAFLAAYDSYADALFRFCYAQAGERERAADAVQETFVRTWKYLTQGRVVAQMRPFLYRTARNVLIDQHRRTRTQSLEALVEAGYDVPDEDAADPLVTSEAAHAIRLAGRMDPKYREPVLLRYLEDMPPREIAEILGENENVISVRINRGLAQLRELMDITHER